MILKEAMVRKSIANFPVTTGTYKSFLEQISILAKAQISSYVCVANVHMLVEAHKNKDYQKCIDYADLITPDGLPITWSLSLLHSIKQERVAGMDLLPDLINLFAVTGRSVFFYGGSLGMLDKTTKYLATYYPSLNIVGTYSPPFRDLDESETEEIISKINAAKPSIVFVILGCPKQEKWMAKMKNRVNCCMIGIGGALPVMIGLQKRAPVWMQRSGLEWFYRFCQEPKRLFKRYTVTNSLFFYLLMRELIKKKFHSNISNREGHTITTTEG